MIRGPNDINRFGSSGFAKAWHLEKAGLFEQQPMSFFVGFFEGRPVYFHGPAGMTITAGGRAGKMRDVILRNLLTGTCLHTLIMLDPKGEGAYLSQNQTADKKYCAFWNPLGYFGFPQDRPNFLGHLTLDSPTLSPDMKVLWANKIKLSTSGSAAYFTARGQEFGEAISLAIVELTGELTYPRLYEAINLIPTGGDAWTDFAFHMSRSRFPLVRSVEAEIATSLNDPTGGIRGVIGELMRSVSCLSDPLLMASVSPPYTVDMKDVVTGAQPWQLYLMPPAEFLDAWAPVIKSAFVSAMLLKSRAPAAPRVTFLIDECGQLASASGFEAVAKLFSYGAGVGCQPIAIFQTNKQMRGLSSEAEAIIQSSAAAKLMFALRDYPSAADCSQMCGTQTLQYDDLMEQERARYARNVAIHSLMTGGDVLQAGLGLAHQDFAASHKAEQQRQLIDPAEVMNLPGDKAIFFYEDVPYPIMLDRRPYWTSRELAGLYHPHPHYPPLDRVKVQTRWGSRMRRVITEPVPQEFSHYPQYRDGLWSRVED